MRAVVFALSLLCSPQKIFVEKDRAGLLTCSVLHEKVIDLKLLKLKRSVLQHSAFSHSLTIPHWWVEQHDIKAKDDFFVIVGDFLVFVPSNIDPKKVLRGLKKGGF